MRTNEDRNQADWEQLTMIFLNCAHVTNMENFEAKTEFRNSKYIENLLIKIATASPFQEGKTSTLKCSAYSIDRKITSEHCQRCSNMEAVKITDSTFQQEFPITNSKLEAK